MFKMGTPLILDSNTRNKQFKPKAVAAPGSDADGGASDEGSGRNSGSEARSDEGGEGAGRKNKRGGDDESPEGGESGGGDDGEGGEDSGSAGASSEGVGGKPGSTAQRGGRTRRSSDSDDSVAD